MVFQVSWMAFWSCCYKSMWGKPPCKENVVNQSCTCHGAREKKERWLCKRLPLLNPLICESIHELIYSWGSEPPWSNGLIKALHLNMAWLGTMPSRHDPLRTLKTGIIAGGKQSWLEARGAKAVINNMLLPDVVVHIFNSGIWEAGAGDSLFEANQVYMVMSKPARAIK